VNERNDDAELDELARALRAVTREAPPSTVSATRARVVASAKRRGGGPPLALAAAAALAIVLGGSTVWAFFTGRLPFGGDDAPVREEPAPVAPEEEHPAKTGRAPAPAVEPQLEPPAVEAEPEPTETEPAALEPEVRRAEPVIEHVERSEPPPIDPAERRAYDRAHALHFDAGDWPAAIDAWDAYLAAFPRGRFRLEARYNRALALVRTGRVAEAREALEPFAEGRFGRYRRTESRALLEALSAEP